MVLLDQVGVQQGYQVPEAIVEIARPHIITRTLSVGKLLARGVVVVRNLGESRSREPVKIAGALDGRPTTDPGRLLTLP